MTAPTRGGQDEDRVLVEQARQGDVRALEALLDRHQGRVLRVLRLLGVPAQDREDVAQEVFVRVFRGLAGFRRGHAFSSWVYKISVNAAYDHRSNRGRIQRGEAPWVEEIDHPHDRGPGPADQLLQADLRRTLEQALETLTPRERAVFVLREMEGLETKEVARSLGIASITVRRHLALARRRLRQRLGESEKNTEIVERIPAEDGTP